MHQSPLLNVIASEAKQSPRFLSGDCHVVPQNDRDGKGSSPPNVISSEPWNGDRVIPYRITLFGG